jgi:hypothetical protein
MSRAGDQAPRRHRGAGSGGSDSTRAPARGSTPERRRTAFRRTASAPARGPGSFRITRALILSPAAIDAYRRQGPRLACVSFAAAQCAESKSRCRARRATQARPRKNPTARVPQRPARAAGAYGKSPMIDAHFSCCSGPRTRRNQQGCCPCACEDGVDAAAHCSP